MAHATHNTRTKAGLDVKQLVVLALLSAMAFTGEPLCRSKNAAEGRQSLRFTQR